MDKELERRGHKFVRYADDFMIYCKSRKAAERVEKSITKFVTTKLKLKVNVEKSAVSRPWLRKYLGFTFISMFGQTKIRIHRKTIERFKARVRELTNRNCGKSLDQVIKGLNQYLMGWWNYYPPDGSPVRVQVNQDLDYSPSAVLGLETMEKPKDQGPQSGKTWYCAQGRYALRKRS